MGMAVHGIGHGAWEEAERIQWGVTRWTRSDLTLASLAVAAQGERVAMLIHCAGSGSVAHSYSAPLDDFQRSVSSVVELLEYARTLPDRPRVVVTSSAAVYGDQGDVDLTETSICSPISPYGFHKLSAEHLCDSYARFFSVPVSVVRLFSVYGEGLRKQLLWDASGKFARGELTFFGTGHELRDWIHVSDAAALLVAAAAEGQQVFEIYNGGHSHATTREVLETLSRAYGIGATPRFSGKTHTGNPRRLTANCAHSRRQLGWAPRVSLDDGLSSYAAWYRESVLSA